MKTRLQFSVRELLLVVFVASFGLAGLSAGGWIAYVAVLLQLILATGLAIVVFVGHGKWRTFAIGFCIPWFLYAAIHVYAGWSELDPFGRLPTTKALGSLYERFVRREPITVSITGEPMAGMGGMDGGMDSGMGDISAMMGGGMGGLGGGGFAGVRETPERGAFMTLAHALLATACAYAGGKFAVWVDAQSARSRVDNASARPDQCSP